MNRKSLKGLIILGIIKGLVTLVILTFFAIFSGLEASAETENNFQNENNENLFEELTPDEVTIAWDDSYLFESKDDALKELNTLKNRLEEINKTFSPEFGNLSGPVLFDYIETDKEFSKSLELLYIYAYTQNSKNMNDEFFASLLADAQNLVAEYKSTNAFAIVKLTALNKEEWERLFSEESKLEFYRPYFESTFMRFAEHRPMNESQATYIADVENQRMKLVSSHSSIVG